MSKLSYVFCISVCLLFLFESCKPHKKTNPTIFTGEETKLTTKTISKNGGEVVIDKPGDPLNGLIIKIPENAYADDRNFIITSAPIKDHKLGPDFNPVSPLISISNGGGYADEMMTLSIPVNVPAGQFAMAFLYDEVSGKLEGMPLIASDGKKVVVATTNFTHSSYSKRIGLAGQFNSSNQEETDKIVISAANEKDLFGEWDSGFRPGVDDLPCQNIGSFLSPAGICSGQSLAALWYYTNKKKKGDPGLYKMLDNDGGDPTPSFTNDDSRAIKLASMMQTEWTFGAVVKRFFMSFIDTWGQMAVSDRVTSNAFAYSIKLTKEPQFVALSGPGLDGHAMIVYKVEDHNLLVADPNFPGKLKKIMYDKLNEGFLPFHSAAKATDPATDYPNIYYMAKSTMKSWSRAEHHFENLENNKIGIEKFPEFSISVLNKESEFVPLTDGFELQQDGSMTLSVRTDDFKNRFTVCDAEGKLLLMDSDVPVFTVPPGTQKIGINLLDRKTANWAGFKWVKVKVPERKEEEKKFGPPTFGDVKVELKINGTPVTYDICNFSIDDKKLLFRIPLNRIASAPVQITLGPDTWNGLGVYNNFITSVILLTIEPTTFCLIKNKTLTITKWFEGKLFGNFSIDCDCNNVPYKIEGEFNYVDPWLNEK